MEITVIFKKTRGSDEKNARFFLAEEFSVGHYLHAPKRRSFFNSQLVAGNMFGLKCQGSFESFDPSIQRLSLNPIHGVSIPIFVNPEVLRFVIAISASSLECLLPRKTNSWSLKD